MDKGESEDIDTNPHQIPTEIEMLLRFHSSSVSTFLFVIYEINIHSIPGCRIHKILIWLDITTTCNQFGSIRD